MLEKFLVRDAANSGWLVFTDPVDVLQTRNPEEVLATLAAIERRVNEESLFAAGFLTYEAASGFDSAYVTRESNHLPLICFGLFSSMVGYYGKMARPERLDGSFAASSPLRGSACRRASLACGDLSLVPFKSGNFCKLIAQILGNSAHT